MMYSVDAKVLEDFPIAVSRIELSNYSHCTFFNKHYIYCNKSDNDFNASLYTLTRATDALNMFKTGISIHEMTYQLNTKF